MLLIYSRVRNDCSTIHSPFKLCKTMNWALQSCADLFSLGVVLIMRGLWYLYTFSSTGTCLSDQYHCHMTWTYRAYASRIATLCNHAQERAKEGGEREQDGVFNVQANDADASLGDDQQEEIARQVMREVKDDELLRRAFAAYEQQERLGDHVRGSARHATCAARRGDTIANATTTRFSVESVRATGKMLR